MLTEIEKSNLLSIKDTCLAQEWQLPTEQSIQAPQSRREARELVPVALWLLLILGMAVGFPVLLWVGR
jgi:hypothetical protein